MTNDAKAKDFIQHSYDKCLYYHVGEDGILDVLMIVHVDDVQQSIQKALH